MGEWLWKAGADVGEACGPPWSRRSPEALAVGTWKPELF